MTGRRTILGFAGGMAAVAAMTLSMAGVSQAAPTTMTLKGFEAPGTPAKYNKVKVVKQGPATAKKILVLIPGTSAGATNFTPLGEGLLAKLNKGKKRNWAIWSIERRENLLEDHSYLEKYMDGDVTAKEMFDYYLGWILDGSVSPRFVPKTDEETAFARDWGMNVAVQDVKKVVNVANKRGREVVLGGHSLGGSITTAYATWNFNGKAGAKDLDGLVFIDGAGAREPEDLPTADEAQATLDALAEQDSPFITLVPPFPWAAGVFNATGSSSAVLEPNEASTVQSSPIIPANLKPPVPATNLAQYGYAVDSDTGPDSLKLVQSHIGQLAASGDPRGWQNGELGTATRAARVFAEKDGMDGTSWYHPARLSADSGAINNGINNPAQAVFGIKATKGSSVKLPMYSFDTSLGDGRVARATRSLAKQSHVPDSQVRTVERIKTYAHIDPLSALPSKNDFIKTLVPFLKKQIK
ncbi:MAG: alpha/beta fold hydrolase [Thermoleophilia bacterium]|nr:alpha/beta fold hydrolase [Thermoleophilia bacterium]